MIALVGARHRATFDPDATNFIPSRQLVPLLLTVPRPLGLKGYDQRQAERLCLAISIPQHAGLVAYSEVLNELIECNYFRGGSDKTQGRTAVVSGGGSFSKEEFQESISQAGVAPVEELKLDVRPTQKILNEFEREHEPEKELVREQPTVAEAYALKVIDRGLDSSVINRWRARPRRPVALPNVALVHHVSFAAAVPNTSHVA